MAQLSGQNGQYQWTVSNLRPGVRYNFTIKAVNAVGEGPVSGRNAMASGSRENELEIIAIVL